MSHKGWYLTLHVQVGPSQLQAQPIILAWLEPAKLLAKGTVLWSDS